VHVDDQFLSVLETALARLDAGFDHLPPRTPRFDRDAIGTIVAAVADRLHDNEPYHHPLYAGQMLKPPHPVARLAAALTDFVNPNNHALDGGRATSAMEKDAVAHLAAMVGWDDALGHLCSGGTVANLEALWVARETSPGVVLASSGAHYTHSRLSGVLGVPFEAVATDAAGRMDVDAARERIARGDVGTLVVTLGATATGAVDPLDRLLPVARDHGVRVHVDAAYGGYFTLASTLEPGARAAFDAMGGADSIVIDPHKHGLQPYGCGGVLFADPGVGRVYHHDSPYTYFTSDALHLGEISLECSRPGAAAAALWATQQLLPNEPGGAFAADLDRCLEAARVLHEALDARDHARTVFTPQLDIVVWALPAATLSASDAMARAVYRAALDRDLHLALATFDAATVARALPDAAVDVDRVACLRSCLMKPAHLDAVPDLLERLDAAVEAVRTPGHESRDMTQ